jgi:cell cycle arrest protein BUB2
MLKVDKLGANEYMRYVSLGPSSVSHKSEPAINYTSDQLTELVVKNDTFRTLATDTQFKGKVKEDMLIRLLEAFVWKNHGKSPF